jgi:hypothetical protein
LLFEVAVCLFAAWGAVYAANQVSPLSIPTGRKGFQPPFQGMTYLINNYDGKRLFTDHDTADMCEMYLKNCSIFQDTNFVGYDEIITSDYAKILMCKPHWQEILAGYKVEWVLTRPGQPIAEGMPSLTGWKIVYQDQFCTVFRKE